MNKNLSIAIAQVNFCVGDIEGNYKKIIDNYNKAVAEKVDIIVFSELAITGYPPEDLILRKNFQDKSIQKLNQLAQKTDNKTALIVGGLSKDNDRKTYNSAAFLYSGKIQKIINKHELPNYGVFDERRVFSKGELSEPVNFKGFKIGILICEDLWLDKVSENLAKKGADIFISLNASPFEVDKKDIRYKIVGERSFQHKIPSIYVNQIGGQDELIFDGSSFITNSKGKAIKRLLAWEESFDISLWSKENKSLACIDALEHPIKKNDKYEEIYNALTLGLRDYVFKNGFKSVLIGMSGGIDSALVAALACNALGAENVNLIMMPSKYTSDESLNDAKECAGLLGARINSIKIDSIVKTFDKTLEVFFKNTQIDSTEENIQSRIRGNILMALSNKFGSIVITTGNKSEMAVGYATLYGDMCGAFNPLKDLYKTEVFKLAKYINSIKKSIPSNIISKPPSAELRENQKDEDSLPPYEILDLILYNLIEKRKSSNEIIELGFDEDIVKKISLLLKNSEYKRKQAPMGTKISNLTFGKERRYPITNKFDY